METFEIDRPMWPWLKTIAIRLAIDYGRQRKAEPCEDPSDGHGINDDTAWLEEGPILEEALAGLPVRQRVALKLRYLDDWSPSEAAAVLGLTRPAFDQLLFRARGKLRSEYRRVCGDAPTRVHVMVWPLLAAFGRMRHGLWRLRVSAQSATMPAQMAADTMAGLVVAATVGAAALGAGLGQLDSATALSPVDTVVVHADSADLAAQSGFSSFSVTASAARDGGASTDGHRSTATAPAASPAASYPDVPVRLAALPRAPEASAPQVEAPPAPAAEPAPPTVDVPDASAATLPSLPATPLSELAPAADLATEAVRTAPVPQPSPAKLPLPDFHEGLGL